MMVHRFYVPATALEEGARLQLPDSVSHQVSRVLRMQPGDNITLFNGSGLEWPAKIDGISRSGVSVTPGPAQNPHREPELSVTVCQALVPSERMEFVIQKGTELGALEFAPVITERVQVKDASVSPRRLERWERIAVEAAEQSGRTRVPVISPVSSLDDCLSRMSSRGPVIMLWEEEREKSLRAAVLESLSSGPGHVGLLIGPVGGLSGAEAVAARSAGAVTAGAGPRILRAETAPVVALTALMLEAGELER